MQVIGRVSHWGNILHRRRVPAAGARGRRRLQEPFAYQCISCVTGRHSIACCAHGKERMESSWSGFGGFPDPVSDYNVTALCSSV